MYREFIKEKSMEEYVRQRQNNTELVHDFFNRDEKCLFWLAWLAVLCCRWKGARWGKGQPTFSGNTAENEIITMQGTSPLPFPSGWLLSFSHFTSISSHFDLSSLLFLLRPLFVAASWFLSSLSQPLHLSLSLYVCVYVSLSVAHPWLTRGMDVKDVVLLVSQR